MRAERAASLGPRRSASLFWMSRMLVLLGILVAACSSTSPDTEVVPTTQAAAATTESLATVVVSEPATSTTGQADDSVLAYFEDIGARRSSIHAEPNSPAFYYAEYLEDLSSSSAEVSAETTVGSEGQIIVKMKDSNGATETIEYTDIEVSAAGVRTFTIENRPLAERLAINVTPTEVKGVTATRVLSYLAVSPDPS